MIISHVLFGANSRRPFSTPTCAELTNCVYREGPMARFVYSLATLSSFPCRCLPFLPLGRFSLPLPLPLPFGWSAEMGKCERWAERNGKWARTKSKGNSSHHICDAFKNSMKWHKMLSVFQNSCVILTVNSNGGIVKFKNIPLRCPTFSA